MLLLVQPMLMTTPPTWFILSLAINVNFSIYLFSAILLHIHFLKLKILILAKAIAKTSYTVNNNEKLEGTKRTDRNTMDFAAKPL